MGATPEEEVKTGGGIILAESNGTPITRTLNDIIRQARETHGRLDAERRLDAWKKSEAEKAEEQIARQAEIQAKADEEEKTRQEGLALQRAAKREIKRRIYTGLGVVLAGLIAIGLAYGYLTLTKDGQELVYQKRIDVNTLLRRGENYKYPRHGDMDRSTNETENPIVFDGTEFFSYAIITRGENGTETWKTPKLSDAHEFSNRGNMRVEMNGQPFMRFGVMKKASQQNAY